MINNTLANKTFFLLCALCMLAPVPAAMAYDEVCMRGKRFHPFFAAQFKVLHGFDEMPPQIDENGVSAYEHLTAQRFDGSDYSAHRVEKWNARGATPWSPIIRSIVLAKHLEQKCVSIRGVRDGELFAVYMLPVHPMFRGGYSVPHVRTGIHCKIIVTELKVGVEWRHRDYSERLDVRRQVERPHRKLVYKMEKSGRRRGTNCQPSHEE